MKLKHTIAALAALTIAAHADFTSIADLAANDAGYIAAAEAANLPEQAAITLARISTTDGAPSTAGQWNASLARTDVQEVLAAAAPVIINNPLLAAHVNYEGVARAWLKTTAGQTWAADHAAQVASFLSNSLHQHLYLFNDYNTPESFAAWKATGYARALGEVAKLENIAFVAGMHGDWPAITALDRSNFSYNVFGYELYAKWAKAQAVGHTIQENYAFVQNELVNVGLTGTPGSLVICQHLNALSTMMFNMMRQGAALQNP